MKQPEPVETYSSSPHLYSDLDIPEGTKGRLPGAGPVRPREPRATEGDRGARSGGRDGNRSGGGRDGNRSSGERSGNSGSRPSRERNHGSTDAVRESAEGGGTHDGTSPTRRRRTRSRRGGAGTPGNTTPPTA